MPGSRNAAISCPFRTRQPELGGFVPSAARASEGVDEDDAEAEVDDEPDSRAVSTGPSLLSSKVDLRTSVR